MNRAEHRGQTVDGIDVAADRTVAMALSVSVLVSIATVTGGEVCGSWIGEAPNISEKIIIIRQAKVNTNNYKRYYKRKNLLLGYFCAKT